jgi:hypothetical protein
MSEQPQSDSQQSINAQDTTIEKSNLGQVVGGNLTQYQAENLYVTLSESAGFVEIIAKILIEKLSSVFKPATQQEYRYRKILINRVKEYWLESVLEQSLHVKALIELGLEKRLDAVDRPFSDVQEIPHEFRQTLPSGTDAIQVFNQMGEGRTLLILGEPGAGKTITLLRLTKSLIACAEKDESLPIPVVFNLSSWATKQQNIDDWLVEELKEKYTIPKELGKVWLKKEQLLLLLDGLDEVRAESREVCLQALNKFLQDHGLTQMVVCSRIRDYEALSTRLKLQGAICIQSLTPEQINQYLEKAGEQLQAVKTLLQEDTALQELAKSPLTLNVMALAYQGFSVEDLPKTGSVEERRKHLFNTYIERMFQRPRASQRYKKTQAIKWLNWLAQQMVQESQTIFLIEKLQPTWLETNFQKLLYALSVLLNIYIVWQLVNFFIGLPILNIYELNNLQIKKSPYYPHYFEHLDVTKNPIFIYIITAIFYFSYSLTMAWKLINNKPFFLCKWLKYIANINCLRNNFIVHKISPLGELIRFYYQLLLRNYLVPEIEPVEVVSWSLENAAKTLKKNLIPLLILGFIFGVFSTIVAVFLGIYISINSNKTLNTMDLFTLIFVIIVAIIAILIMGLICSLLFIIVGTFPVFLLGGIRVETTTETTVVPNQGIWKSAKNIVNLGLFGVFVGISFNIFSIVSSAFMPLPGEQNAQLTKPELLFLLYQILILAIPFGLLAAGVCNKHFILRVIMYFSGYAPWNYARFLDYATERIFLQKVGGGYIFIHRLLLEHFAQMELEQVRR